MNSVVKTPLPCPSAAYCAAVDAVSTVMPSDSSDVARPAMFPATPEWQLSSTMIRLLAGDRCASVSTSARARPSSPRRVSLAHR